MHSEQITLDYDPEAKAYFDDLHKRCPWWSDRYRPRECDWAPSGYCTNCARPRPTYQEHP